jgi:hypothetical protein
MRGLYLRFVREKDGTFRPMSPNTEGQFRVLVVSKRFGRRLVTVFHAPEPFTIIGQRELAYRRWHEASIVSEARIWRVTGLMTRAQPCPYALRAAISGWMPRMFNTRVRL